MKTFIYSIKYKKAKFNRNVELSVYRVKKNVPVYIGFVEFNTGSTRGDTSEAYRCLCENNQVSKKLYREADGYYYRSSDDIKIFNV